MELSYLSLILGVGSLVFSAGAWYQRDRSTRRDLNGMGVLLRGLRDREQQHYLTVLRILLGSQDPAVRDEARAALTPERS